VLIFCSQRLSLSRTSSFGASSAKVVALGNKSLTSLFELKSQSNQRLIPAFRKDTIMILGMSLRMFTYLHVYISLIAIGAGLIVVYGMIAAKRLPLLTSIFLITTALTSLTGFLFPFKGVTPGIVVGILSLIVLVLAVIARRRSAASTAWRGTYVISAILALYFNIFVLIVQSFEKIPALHELAPTQSEIPFKLAQLATLIVIIALTTAAFKKYRPA
jgi:hypothetical protein